MSNTTDNNEAYIKLLFSSFIDIFQNPLDRTNALINMFYNLGYDKNIREITTTNDDITASTFRCYCLAYIAYTVPNIEFTSSSDAQNLLENISQIFEAELQDTSISGDTFSWLSRLKMKITADISTRGSVLPEINQFSCELIPLPVVSQYLYQTGDRLDEIIQRNNSKIIHPLFFTGNLEVLST